MRTFILIGLTNKCIYLYLVKLKKIYLNYMVIKYCVWLSVWFYLFVCLFVVFVVKSYTCVFSSAHKSIDTCMHQIGDKQRLSKSVHQHSLFRAFDAAAHNLLNKTKGRIKPLWDTSLYSTFKDLANAFFLPIAKLPFVQYYTAFVARTL